MNNSIRLLLLPLVALILPACGSSQKGESAYLGEPVYYGRAEMRSLGKHKTWGSVNFSEAFGKLKLTGRLHRLKKNEKHALVIYEFGDCSKAGTRLGQPLRARNSAVKVSIGRIGNISSSGKSKATVNLEVEGLGINTGEAPVLGRALVVHRYKDDLISQGDGGAGEAMACGVIGASLK